MKFRTNLMLSMAAMTMALTLPAVAQTKLTAELTLEADKPAAKIDRNIYGHFVEHLGRGVYEGIWVGKDSPIPNTRGIRNDVVAALKKLNVPVVRWPGGCFADDYHWRDGVGPERKATINSNWNRQPEPNSFGTHEFMDFVAQINAAPYVSVNMGSGTVAEAQGWLQYMTAEPSTGPGSERAKNGQEKPWAVPYVGVGNESWGCGGNMYAAEYADEFRKFAAYMRTSSGPRAQLIATGPDTDDYEWTDVVMRQAMKWRPNPTPLMYSTERPLLAGLSLHYYTLPTNKWDKKGIATGFGEDAWISTMQRAQLMDELIVKHSQIMDKYDPGKKVALIVDEWGTWFDADPKGPSGLYQQNTLRDALVAGVTLNIFHAHADRVRMANIAQMINVLQAMILTDKDKMILTPTYHVFEMYKVHQDATSIPLTFTSPTYSYGSNTVPALSVSASRDAAGKVHVSVVNLDPHRSLTLTAHLKGVKAATVIGQVITAEAMDAHNDFNAPDRFVPQTFKGAKLKGADLTAQFPPKSVTVLELK
jgi:alpha-L-arabinofuranosidase